MSETEFSYVFAWHSLSDACPKCQRLNGREWRDQDLFANRLYDVFEGDIWDLDASHTLAHPNCRCQLEVRVIMGEVKIPEWQELAELLGVL